jgi:pimeloyl-ACP methyl ester carboxylesterase
MGTNADDLGEPQVVARANELADPTVLPVRPPLTHVPLSDTPLPPLDTAIPPWPGDHIDAGGTRLHVRRTPGPRGSIAVYVHGLGGSATNWTDLAAQLSQVASGVAVDLPGFGRTVPPNGFDFSLVAQTETVATFLRGLDAGPVHLIGNSMGGAISMLVAAEYPDLVRTLTLISPAVPDLRPLPSRLSDPRLPLTFLPVIGPQVRRQLASVTPIERAEQLLRLCYADSSSVPVHRKLEAAEEFAERAGYAWASTALERSTIGLFKAWLAPKSRSLWMVAPRVTAPTLVVWGTEDKLVTVRKAPRTAQLMPRARLLVLPRTGHVAQMERPVTVARAVLGLWESADTDSW